jgi:predicted  nucleic acid-binding Zn-ribbon protein
MSALSNAAATASNAHYRPLARIEPTRRAAETNCAICGARFTQPKQRTRKYCTDCVPSGYSYHKKYNRVYKDSRSDKSSLTTTEKMPDPTPETVQEPTPEAAPEQTKQPEKIGGEVAHIRPTKGVGRSEIMRTLAANMKALDTFFDKIGSKRSIGKVEMLRVQSDYLETAGFVYNWLRNEVEGE